MDEIIITPGAKSKIFFTLKLKKMPKSNAESILQALDQLPVGSSTLEEVRKDYTSGYRL